VFNPTAFYLGDLWQRYASKLNSELEVEGRLEAEEGVQGFCGGFCTFSRLSELLVKQTGGYKKRKKREKVFVLGVREKSKSTTSMLIISLLGAEVTSGRGKRENGEKNEGACAPS